MVFGGLNGQKRGNFLSGSRRIFLLSGARPPEAQIGEKSTPVSSAEWGFPLFSCDYGASGLPLGGIGRLSGPGAIAGRTLLHRSPEHGGWGHSNHTQWSGDAGSGEWRLDLEASSPADYTSRRIAALKFVWQSFAMTRIRRKSR